MRSRVLVLAWTFGVACGGYAFAADEAPQPLTRADCDAAGMTWNDGTNVCGSADSSGDIAAAQPLTRADCDAADMTWNDGANVCGSADTMAAASAADSSGDMAAAQPLTRADCDAAGMTWNDGANVCGVDSMAAAQPLTRADCKAAGMKWNDGRNVCGSFLAAAAAAHAHKKEMKKEVKNGGTKVVKKVKTGHGVKKTVIHKKGHKQDTAAKKGSFLEWLNGKKKKS